MTRLLVGLVLEQYGVVGISGMFEYSCCIGTWFLARTQARNQMCVRQMRSILYAKMFHPPSDSSVVVNFRRITTLVNFDQRQDLSI